MTGAPEALLARLGGLSTEEAGGALGLLGEDDWALLVDAAVRHGLGPLLALELRRLPQPPRVPTTAARRLEDLYLHSSLRSRSLQKQLAEAIGALRTAGIQVVALKGAHLAGTVYPDPAARPMNDIDLLVRPETIPAAFAALKHVGYATDPRKDESSYDQHLHCAPLMKRGAVSIEIHRRLLGDGAPFTQDLDGVWNRVRPAKVGGIDAWVLAPEDLVHHLSLHAGWNHGFNVPLLALCDIAGCARHFGAEIDWARLRRVTEREGSWPVVHAILDLARTEARAPVPTDVCPPLEDAAARELLRRHLFSSNVPELPAAYQRFRRAGDTRSGLRALLDALFPPPREMRSIYRLGSRSPVAPYYLLRPLDLLIRRGRLAWKVLTRSRDIGPALDREADRKAVRDWLERPGR